MNELIQNFSVYVLPILFAITLHEAAHAYAAKYFGDSTAYLQGRMSLNPVVHIDVFGTIVLPLITYFASSQIPGSPPLVFGYAKPVPVDWGKLRKPKRDMAWVALAGPGVNLVMALMWLTLEILLKAMQFNEPFFIGMAQAGVFVNLVIFALNLFPLPPLDGGRIMFSILPNRLAYKYGRLEPYGFFILLALLFLQLLKYWMYPVMIAGEIFLRFLVSPLTFLLS